LFTVLILYLGFALERFGDMSRVQLFEMFVLIIRCSGVLLSELQTSARIVLGIRIFFLFFYRVDVLFQLGDGIFVDTPSCTGRQDSKRKEKEPLPPPIQLVT